MRQPAIKLVALLVSTLFAQTPPSNPTIRVPVRLVTAPTLVFSKDNHLIPNLQQGDFRLFDNGSPQHATLDTASTLLSVIIVAQVSQDVRSYLPFIQKTGSTVENLLLGESGEAAVIAYSDDVSVVKSFNDGELQSAFKNLVIGGRRARMVDAGLRAITLFKERPRSRSRILIFIGQAMDSGSESVISSLEEATDRENVTVYALTLPEFGKAFVSDTFSLEGAPRGQRGGFQAGVDLGNLVSVLSRKKKAEESTDPFSALTSATGGAQIHFRKQYELQNAIAAIGVDLRSAYILSFSPSTLESGYHTIKVEVDIPERRLLLVPDIGWMRISVLRFASTGASPPLPPPPSPPSHIPPPPPPPSPPLPPYSPSSLSGNWREPLRLRKDGTVGLYR